MTILYYDPKTNKLFEGVFFSENKYYLRSGKTYYKLDLMKWIPKRFVKIGSV